MLRAGLAGGGIQESEWAFWRQLPCPFARAERLDDLVDFWMWNRRCNFGEGFISRDYIGTSDADSVEMLSPG
jgi:hypothetical protein